jgi:hypothetical protein
MKVTFNFRFSNKIPLSLYLQLLSSQPVDRTKFSIPCSVGKHPPTTYSLNFQVGGQPQILNALHLNKYSKVSVCLPACLVLLQTISQTD